MVHPAIQSRSRAAADFREDESDRRREGAYAALWFFNARASARAFVCKVRIFRSSQRRDRGLEAPTADMHISSGRNEYIIHNLFRTVDL